MSQMGKGPKLALIFFLFFIGLGSFFFLEKKTPFEVRLKRLIEDFPHAHIGFYAIDTATGQEIGSLNAHDFFIPASVAKLFISSGALLTLGKDYHFETKLWSQNPMNSEGILFGDLILEGRGDPTLSKESFFHLPIKEIKGKVIEDQSFFTDLPYSEHVEMGDVNQKYLKPTFPLMVERSEHASKMFDEKILIRNESFEGEKKYLIGKVLSPPLKDILAQFLKVSDNFIGEMILRSMGGSREKGITAIRSKIASLTDSEPVYLYEGAGLSRHALVTPKGAVLLLAKMNSAFFTELLAKPGEGTLKERFIDTPLEHRLRGKTGSLERISNLAGYIDQKTRRIAFALFINYSPYSKEETLKRMDRHLIQLFE